MNSDAKTGGFADPVFQSQAVFRAVLDAFSRPGKVVEIPEVVEAPAPLHLAAASIIATLADEGTPVHVDSAVARSAAAIDWIRFHTDAPIVASPDASAFAVVVDPATMPPLTSFALGSAEYPDRSTTLIIQVETVSRETGFQIEGPGVNGTTALFGDPLPTDFIEQMRQNRALYPLGVDIVLAAPQAIVTLPRSVRIRKERGG